MGSQFFETPNLDALAEESLVFTDAYMYPLCSPSRAAIATGQHSFRAGVYGVPVLERGDDQTSISSRWTCLKKIHIMQRYLVRTVMPLHT